MPKFIDKTGKIFGSLVVISYAGKYKHGGAQWLCKCNVCGSEVICRAQKLGTSKTCSPKCGVSISNTIRAVHGCASRTSPKQKLHRTWGSIKQRCNNLNNASYNSYGGRGIHIYPAWEKDFKAFYEYIGEPPNYTERWSIERIDNSKGYEPNNIKWALPKEQASNKRTNIWISHDGKELTIEQWADLLGISSTTIINRRKDGKSVEDVLKPRNPNYKQQIPYEGSMYTVKELSILTGVPYQTVWYRHSKGLPVK
jgi:hypothetical protein